MIVRAYVVDSNLEKWELESILKENGSNEHKIGETENWGLAPIKAYIVKTSYTIGEKVEKTLLKLNYLYAYHPGIEEDQVKYWIYEMFSYFNFLYLLQATLGYRLL